MTEEQIDEVVTRAASGEGVEDALEAMGFDVNLSTEELKRHSSARGRIKAAKVPDLYTWQTQGPISPMGGEG